MDVIARDEWGAKHGRGTEANGLREGVVLHHFAAPHTDCGVTQAVERTVLQSVERHHAEVNGWAGIGYHFVVFQSGRIYEGRGWERTGAHASGKNRSHFGIALAIDGANHSATNAAREAVRYLIADAVRRGLLPDDYELVGHRDVGQTTCPGELVYRHLASFRHDGP